MEVEPLNYANISEPRESRHNRIYTALLIALALLFALSGVSIWFVSRDPNVGDGVWVFHMVCCIYAVLIMAIIATLVLRAVAPGAGRIATMSLNIILLVIFPLGTALGIYGLLKVDKPRRE
jgi:hypothetical protein